MIDITKFEEEYGLTNADLLMLLEEFQQNISNELPELKSMLNNADFANLSLTAHKHKSPAASLELFELSDLLKSIELNAKTEPDTIFLSTQLETLSSHLSELTNLIKELKNQ